MKMIVKPKTITIKEFAEGYSDDDKGGVVGFGGRLDIRPHYQRESVYNRESKDRVIDSITRGFPISIMYWAVRDDGDYEILDGQQRTIAICEYIIGKNSFQQKYFDSQNPSKAERDILQYKITVYVCDGEFDDKMDWFETVNISGVPLKPQEIRNAVYAGRWTSDARRWFSKHDCFAYRLGKDYMSGSHIRQDYLETAIQWHAGDKSDKAIREYMAKHTQRIKNAPDTKDPAKHLYNYFEEVINWVKKVFPDTKKEMAGVDWGRLHREYGNNKYDDKRIKREVNELMECENVDRKGIFEYVLIADRKYRHNKLLEKRAFADGVKTKVFNEQKGVCPVCKNKFKLQEMQADHIIPWSKGGTTALENCQMLCRACNQTKGAK